MKRKISFIIFILLLFVMGKASIAVPAYDEDYYDSKYRYTNSVYEKENIRDYYVEMYVNKDGSMDVTEKITVYAKGKEIKHGIYRDFPTEYDNKRVTLDVQEILCDDRESKYTLSNVDRGIRIRIGDADTYLDEGLHTYSVKYRTERQLAFYDDYDELYWNVIGSGWNFEIEKCNAKIYFPEGTKFLQDKLKTYTGSFGVKGNTVEVSSYFWEVENCVEFNIYDKLGVQEAFTVSICFEKGAVDEPSFETRVRWFVEDNCIPLVIFVLIMGLIVWQYFVWKKYGKDPEARVIIPKYYPPEGFEPADVRYIDKMGSTINALEATILNIAVKGFFKFSQKDKKSDIVIEKISKGNVDSELSSNELAVYRKFDDKETLKYSSGLQSKLLSLRQHFEKDLKKKHDGRLFIRNDKYKVISGLLSVLIIVVSMIVGGMINLYATEMAWVCMIVAVVMSVFIIAIFRVLRNLKSFKLSYRIFVIVLCAVFFGTTIIGITVATVPVMISNIFAVCAFLALILDNYLFFMLVRRYTEEGQIVKEDIEGFKMFISTAKDDDFADKTPEMFDKYFPYAYVLGLQNKWADKFEDVLRETGYVPNWCSYNMMDNGMFNVVIFTNSFSSSFSSGMSSASTAPSSSGGSGGGGFSGGGGGGRWPEVAGDAYYKGCTLYGITLFLYVKLAV